MGKPSILMITAAVSALSIATSPMTGAAIAAEDAAPKKAASTRLGSAIESDLAARDKSDADRQRQLDLQEQAVAASQKRLDAGLQEAKPEGDPTKKPVDGKPAPKKGEVAEETSDQLARIYMAMKPKKAAAVFEKLDLELQIAVARKMRERETGKILAEMSPNGAARLSMALAGRRTLAAKP